MYDDASGSGASASVNPKPEFASFRDAVARNPLRIFAILAGKGPAYFRSPVRWLFGDDLLARLRNILAYSAYGEELDHRDWMHPEVIDLTSGAPQRSDESANPEQGEAFWFDYLSDAGDGQLTMYNLAFLCLSDLYLDGTKISFKASDASGERLPRGAFLFVGGDTAYHIADHGTVRERLCKPFDWALGELEENAGDSSGSRYVFGIPGNHDYYDALSGFNHVFRAPLREADPLLKLADFRRLQRTSYVALKLPFGWHFWGLDTHRKKLDYRQKHFFLDQCVPAKLIVATPEPASVFARVSKESAAPFESLGLPRPFLEDSGPQDGCIHLDLAGDVHHYARYWGGDGDHYASVVSGGGGAFLHPSHTEIETAKSAPVPVERRWPESDASKSMMTKRLLCPWFIASGGYVWLAGAVVAVSLYFGAVVSRSTKVLVEAIATLVYLMGRPDPSALPERVATVGSEDVRATVTVPAGSDFLEFFRRGQPTGGDFGPFMLTAAEGLSLSVTVCAFVMVGLLSKDLFDRATQSSRTPVFATQYGLLLLPLIAPGVVFASVHGVTPESGVPVHPLRASLLVLFCAGVLVASVIWAYRYSATLPKQAKLPDRVITSGDYWPARVAVCGGVLSAAYGIVTYGRHSFATLVWDTLLMGVLLLCFVGLPLMGAFQGAAGRRWTSQVGFALLGLWLGFLVAVVPLVLTLYGGGENVLAVAGVVTVGSLLSLPLARRAVPGELLGAWIVFGIVTLLAATHRFGDLPAGSEALRDFIARPPSPSRFALAFFTGAFLTSLWFGWYLATALAFNGHNNEAGGAARLDRYRHFLRIRLTENALTAFVIGFERPRLDARTAQPVLVETFTLKRQGVQAAADAPQ